MICRSVFRTPLLSSPARGEGPFGEGRREKGAEGEATLQRSMPNAGASLPPLRGKDRMGGVLKNKRPPSATFPFQPLTGKH